MIEKAVTSFEKGLVLVNDSLNQPAGTYPFALNATRDNPLITPGVVSNERGFDKYANLLNVDDIVLGYQALDTKDFVLFIYNPNQATSSKICLFSDSSTSELIGNLTTLYANNDLNFNPLYPIKTEYKVNYKGNRIIYYVDGINPPRSLNIDDLTGYNANAGSFYPKYSVPVIESSVNDSGGSLKSGSYQFFCFYKNNDISTTYTALTNSVYILKAPISNTSIKSYEKGGNESEIPTSKSIQLTISNLDSNFNKLGLGVLITINGVSTAYIIKDNIPYSTTSLSYLYTGTESTTDILDINEVLVDPAIIQTSNVIGQKDNRLLLGDVTYVNNVLNYQSYANNIGVTWYTEAFEGNVESLSLRVGSSLTNKFDTQDLEVSKQLTSSFDVAVPLSFMRDEVYALGIQFELKAGGYTPVYHIPGRALNKKSDGSNFTVADTNSEIDFNYSTWDSETNLIVGYPSVSRWKVINTASQEGELAYYESEEVYPAGYGFPTTGSSTNGEGSTKIRHHKMPDSREAPLLTTDTVGSDSTFVATTERNYLGLTFSNIEIPAEILEVISGFRIMVAPRDSDSNKSIIGKGIFQNIFTSESEGILYGHTSRKYNNYDTGDDDSDLSGDNTGNPQRENRLKGFYSPDTLFESPTLSASKISVEAMFKGIPYYIYHNTADNQVLENCSVCLLNQYNTVSRSFGNIQRDIQDCIYIPFGANTASLGNINLVSRFYNTSRQPLVLLQLESDINQEADQDDENTVNNLESTNLTSYLYGSLKKNNPNQYGDILNIVYNPTSLYIKNITVDGNDLVTNTVSGLIGDTYIEFMTKKITHTKYKDYITNAAEMYYGVIGFFVETPLNIRYRLIGEDLFNTAYPQGIFKDRDFPYLYAEKTFEGSEQFTLNTDFNLKYTNKVYEAYSTKLVDIGLNNQYQTRLLYSDRDNYDSIYDNYRIFRANNYRDLPKHKGRLTSLFTKQEILYGTTVNSLWMLQTSQQQLQTDTSSIIIGTGDFLAIEPKEILSIQSGYMGTNSNLCVSHSPHGTLLVDSERGSIFLFDGGGMDITLTGIQQFFFQNKDFALAKYGFTNINNPHNPNSIGYLTSYNIEDNKFLITKRDYDLITPALFKGTLDDIDDLIEEDNLEIGDVLLDVDNQRFNKVLTISPTTTEALNLTNTEYFYNKGFTLSYNTITKNWVSFHSYIPTNYFEVRERLFSRDAAQSDINTQAVYRHNKGIYGQYYGSNIKPFILETTLTANNAYTKVFDSFAVECFATSNDDTYNSKTIYDLCFDKVILYNDKQCSGEVELTTDFVKRTERVWRFNDFKDLSVNVNYPIWLTDLSDLQTDYYIDKVLNEDRIDSNKAWYEKARFRDKYINARFILNNLDNKKFLCTFVSSNYRASRR